MGPLILQCQNWRHQSDNWTRSFGLSSLDPDSKTPRRGPLTVLTIPFVKQSLLCRETTYHYETFLLYTGRNRVSPVIPHGKRQTVLPFGIQLLARRTTYSSLVDLTSISFQNESGPILAFFFHSPKLTGLLHSQVRHTGHDAHGPTRLLSTRVVGSHTSLPLFSPSLVHNPP